MTGVLPGPLLTGPPPRSASRPEGALPPDLVRARLFAAVLTVGVIPVLTVPWVDDTRLSPTNAALLIAIVAWSGARLAWLAFSRECHFVTIIFLVFAYIFVGVSSLFQAVTGRFPLDNLDYSQAAITQHVLVLAIGIAAFEVGHCVARRVVVRRRRDPRPARPQRDLGLSPHRLLAMGALGTCFVAFQVAKHGPLAFFVSRDQTAALLAGYEGAGPLYLTADKSGGLISTFLAQYLVFVALYLILYARRRGMWAPDAVLGVWGWRAAIAVLVAANVVMNNPAGNGRYWFCTIAVCFASVYLPVQKRRNMVLYVASALVILLLAFSFLDYFRVTDRSAQDDVNRGLSNASYPVLQSGINGERYIELNGHADGHQLQGALLGFVPRRVWPGKAGDTGQLIDPQYARSASAWTEMQVDFGVGGVVVLFALWGVGAAAADRRLSDPQPGVVPAFLVLLSVYQLFLLRGSFLSAFGTLYQIAFLFACGAVLTRSTTLTPSQRHSPGGHPMRVVHAVWSLDPLAGGLARAVVLVANAHAAAGLRVVVLTTHGRGEQVSAERAGLAPGIEVVSFPRRGPLARWAGAPGLRGWLADHLGPDDVVHTHAVWDLASRAAAQVAIRRGCRLVMSPHGSLEPFDLRKHALAKRLLGPLVVRPSIVAATVHCTTQREADCLESYGASARIAVVPLPVGAPPGAAGDGARFRARHGLPAEGPIMLFLGRVNYKKGLTHLARALARMQVPAHLVIAGSGEPDHERGVRALADELGVGDRISWLGWIDRDEQADAFSAADVFVLLSDAENYGISVVEAIQHDLAVLASDEVGIAADLARLGAVLISPRTPVEAAARLDEVLTDESLREDTRARAREALLHELDDKRLADDYAALVRPVVAR